MDTLLPLLHSLLGVGRVTQHESLATHSSFAMGGQAAVFVQVETQLELQKTVLLCLQEGVTYKVVGSGTLAVFSDNGFNGVIIKNNTRRFEVMTMLGKIQQQQINVATAMLYAESGANTNQVVRYSLEQGLSGLEYHLGLPGTIGGAIYSNAQFPQHKAYIGDHVKSARILTNEGEIMEVDRAYFTFGFDDSSLQKTGDVLLSVLFELTPGNKTHLWEKAMEASTLRTNDQPHEKGYTYRNMQVISSEEGLIMQPDALEILEQANLTTFAHGDVKLSEKRYNYLINTQNATAQQFVTCISELSTEVKNKKGSEIQIKPYLIGEI